jgi:hypothetical protein
MITQNEWWIECDKMIAEHGPIEYIVFPGKSETEVSDEYLDEYAEAVLRGIRCEFDPLMLGSLIVHHDPDEIT